MKIVLIPKEENTQLKPIFISAGNFKLLAKILKSKFKNKDQDIIKFIAFLEKNEKEKSGELACRWYGYKINNKYKMREYFN